MGGGAGVAVIIKPDCPEIISGTSPQPCAAHSRHHHSAISSKS